MFSAPATAMRPTTAAPSTMQCVAALSGLDAVPLPKLPTRRRASHSRCCPLLHPQAMDRERLAKANPLVAASKVDKL